MHWLPHLRGVNRASWTRLRSRAGYPHAPPRYNLACPFATWPETSPACGVAKPIDRYANGRRAEPIQRSSDPATSRCAAADHPLQATRSPVLIRLKPQGSPTLAREPKTIFRLQRFIFNVNDRDHRGGDFRQQHGTRNSTGNSTSPAYSLYSSQFLLLFLFYR